MRHDYGLYLIAIICFVLAVFLFMGYTGYLQLTTGNEVTDLVAAMFSAVLGVVFVGMGYGVRPKEALPVQPASPETSAKQNQLSSKCIRPNARNVEATLLTLEKAGRWLAVQTEQEKGLN